jgi:hypothetical protein
MSNNQSQSRTAAQMAISNTYGSERHQKMDFAACYNSSKTIIRRPCTAFHAKKQLKNPTATSYDVMSLTARGDAPVSSYGVVDQTRGVLSNNKNNIGMQQPSLRASAVITDPEGIDALSQIDQFEKENKKKPNRYPKAQLERTENLDENMKTKIKLRTQMAEN